MTMAEKSEMFAKKYLDIEDIAKLYGCTVNDFV